MILENARSAARALRSNRLRTALTMLGIIIGVAAVIAMVAVGTGAQARVDEQIQSLGTNLHHRDVGQQQRRGASAWARAAASRSPRTTPTRSSRGRRSSRRRRPRSRGSARSSTATATGRTAMQGVDAGVLRGHATGASPRAGCFTAGGRRRRREGRVCSARPSPPPLRRQRPLGQTMRIKNGAVHGRRRAGRKGQSTRAATRTTP